MVIIANDGKKVNKNQKTNSDNSFDPGSAA